MHRDQKNTPRTRIASGAKALLALGFGLFLAGIPFIGAELYFRHLEINYTALKPEVETWDPFPFVYGSEYGYDLCTETVVKHTKTSYGKPLYSVLFSTDACGYRITPVDNREDRTHFLAFFGCSFTFGQTVNDDETLEAQVARRAPAYMPYNYALPGYGPQQMLLQLMQYDLRGTMPEKEGIGIYTFIDDHINRAIGSMRHVTSWTKRFPCFEEKNGALAYLGSYERAHPYRLLVYRLISHDYILRHYGVNWPVSPSIYDINLTVAIIAESAKRFAEIFPGSPFYVVLYPWSSNTYGGDVIRLLRERQISCLDYRTLFKDTPPEKVRFIDTHPTPEGYARVAQILVSDLNLGAQCPGSW
ncbi:MAG TPA: SGNH/GDSL hydrolase family protein [Candidatus Hydrogenedentes bacterium]|nr:SGNH/GDSL hydrolase family protein [Candidatus Hydrogenedentota bacterium]